MGHASNNCYLKSLRRVMSNIVAAVLLGGIGPACMPVAPADPALEGNLGIDPADFPSMRVVGEPNDTFSTPLDVVFNG